MPEPVRRSRSGAGVVGRAMLGSAVLMLVLAALFFTGVFPGAERTRVLVAMILGFAAAIDALAGVLFLLRDRS